ncbi:BTB/POZ domain-containing protein 9-like isoform X2 [Bradysia coprophila]|uniref:BTB/POZ domain-containing protein 9-like isoform X1 n=1 Tax=Bradysia coprophila TaxID=38358 RepID=UPI00187D84F5|nr:BTB/POZ domain-containing protein 9-like isoform X1 [Bradysia coprophila]XP_037035106.1 BTB/POZ domain-containing protein 9-like isoform X2 [Bradysia coprophila]
MSTIRGELNFSANIIKSSVKLYLNPDISDVVFVVDGEKVPAHKFILSLRSSYFHALISGSFSESSRSEIVLNVPLIAFKHVLRYIYTGCVSLQEMDRETVLELLSLSDEYTIEELKSGITSYLKETVTINNCWTALNTVCLNQSKEMEAAVLHVLRQNTEAVLQSDDLKTFSSGSLRALLQRDTFFVAEIDLFKAVLKWRQHNTDVPDNDFQTIVSSIRFELVELEHLVSTVRESGALSDYGENIYQES